MNANSITISPDSEYKLSDCQPGEKLEITVTSVDGGVTGNITAVTPAEPADEGNDGSDDSETAPTPGKGKMPPMVAKDAGY